VPRLWPYCTCCTASDQSSDRFISIQTVSMDTSCNRVQDRTMISFRSDYGESKSAQNGGDSMKTTSTMTMTTTGSKGIGRSRVLASMALLFGAIFTIFLLPAYGQQEVDPTWYDPWAAPIAAVVHPAQPPAAVHLSQSPVSTHRYQQTVRSVSPTADAGKFRVKDTQLDQSRHNAAHKSGGTPSADSRLPGAVRLAGFETRAAEARGTETRDAASVPRDGVALRSALGRVSLDSGLSH
jgi:hypothetical protein